MIIYCEIHPCVYNIVIYYRVYVYAIYHYIRHKRYIIFTIYMITQYYIWYDDIWIHYSVFTIYIYTLLKKDGKPSRHIFVHLSSSPAPRRKHTAPGSSGMVLRLPMLWFKKNALQNSRTWWNNSEFTGIHWDLVTC